MRYSLDSDVLIQAWRDYPIEHFPKVWRSLEELGRKKILGIVDVVYSELEKGGDELFDWFKKRKDHFVVPTNSNIEKKVTYLVNTYNNFGLITGKNEGDPYVVALAMVEQCLVVTNESMSNDLNGPKIPDVCRKEGVHWIKIVDIIKNERLDVG